MAGNRFFWRAFPSLLLVSAFVLLYEATVSDSRYAARQAELLDGTVKPVPGTRLTYEATAYCKGETTASGVAVRSGIAAADPEPGRLQWRAAGASAVRARAPSAVTGACRRGRSGTRGGRGPRPPGRSGAAVGVRRCAGPPQRAPGRVPGGT